MTSGTSPIEPVEVRVSRITTLSVPAQDVVHGHQNLLGDGHDRAIATTTGLEAPKLVPEVRPLLRGPADWATSTNNVFKCTLPLRLGSGPRFPALSLLPGQTPAHAARCASLRNTRMSTPSSATIPAAATRLIPGIFVKLRAGHRIRREACLDVRLYLIDVLIDLLKTRQLQIPATADDAQSFVPRTPTPVAPVSCEVCS